MYSEDNVGSKVATVLAQRGYIVFLASKEEKLDLDNHRVVKFTISGDDDYKEIYDRLEVTHEGISQVKKSKISILVHKYELFKIEPNETILCMYTCFTDIVNNLKNLAKTYTDSELCRKIHHSLSRTWEAKVTAIQEPKDLTCLKVKEILGSLMTHELILN